jgi:peptidoglycan/LPS O-acetylase OafA/YrhL
MARHRTLLLLSGLVLWAPNVFVPPETVFVRSLGLTANFLGSGAFLLAAFHTNEANLGPAGRFARPLATFGAWIGVYSYAIYLWHVTAIRILEREFVTRLLSATSEESSLLWLIATVVVCAGAVLAGVIATKLVEWPVLRFRDRYFPSRSTSLPAEAEGDAPRSELHVAPPSRDSVTSGA